jgi:D-3-phosphoglycerate dehydrogenase
MAGFKILAIGDKFIGSHVYLETFNNIKDLLPDGSQLELSVVEWNLDKATQHQLQQVMEWDGANAVEAPAEILSAVSNVEAIVMHFAPIGKKVIEAAQNLKLIVAARAGLENVDIESATSRGVLVSGIIGRNAAAVAELAIGLMLSECRNISRADRSIKDGGWRKEFSVPMIELGQSSIGIVGFGQVAQHLANKLSGLSGRILVHDPYSSEDFIRSFGAEPVSFEEIFTKSDFVHVMARLTPETERFVGAREFNLMKPGAYFINTARSRLVNYEDLYEAVKSGRIAGAGLDVFDEEPLSANSPWRTLDNVTMTTHYGGDTTGTNKTSTKLVLEAVAEFNSTGKLASAVNAPD